MRLCSLVLLVAAAAALPALGAEPLAPLAPLPIQNIDQFLDRCPQTDVAWAQITSDFQVRRNGAIVALPSCTGSVAALPAAQYTDELIVLQGLRTTFHLSDATAGTLPWTSVNLYNWLAAKIDGFNIDDAATVNQCCDFIDGKLFVKLVPKDDFNRSFSKKWEGISANVGLYFHEARHMDTWIHTSCCGIDGGCDQSYTTNALSPYGIQWWLEEAWLRGTMNAGIACLNATRTQEIRDWHVFNLGSTRTRFCTSLPPVVGAPAQPGGACGDADANGAVDVIDVFSLINHLFAGGVMPKRPCDVNGSGATDVADVFYLIHVLFAGGPQPF